MALEPPLDINSSCLELVVTCTNLVSTKHGFGVFWVRMTRGRWYLACSETEGTAEDPSDKGVPGTGF